MNNSNYVTELRASVVRFVDARDELISHKIVWDALNVGGTLSQEDLTGANADLIVDDVIAFVTSTTNIHQYIVNNFLDTSLQKARA